MTEIRPARSADRARAVELLDAAMLELDADSLRERIASGDVLVADADARVVGVCVLEPRERAAAAATTEITQIAVHRSRRARGIGRSLVETAAAETDGPLTATFRGQVRPFYEALGFEVREADADGDGADGGGSERFRGVLELR